MQGAEKPSPVDRVWALLNRYLEFFVPLEAVDSRRKRHGIRETWRERAFFIVVASTLVLALAAYIPALLVFIEAGRWLVVGVYSLCYLLLAACLFHRRISFRVRAGIGISIFWLVGFFDLVAVGSFGSGKLIFLFASVLACITMGTLYGLLTLAANTLALVALFFFLNRLWPQWQQLILSHGPEFGWIVTGVTMLVVGCLSIIALDVVTRGLLQSLERSADLEQTLRKDIARRQEAEAALSASEAKHRALVENTADIIMRFDSQSRFLYANPAVAVLTGQPPDFFIGRTPLEVGLPKGKGRFLDRTVRMVFKSACPAETEFSLDTPGGLVTVEWRLFPEFDDQGRVTSVMSVARDITRQRRSEENYRMLFSKMPDGFVLHDTQAGNPAGLADFRFLNVNPAFEKITGLTLDQLNDKTLADVAGALDFYADFSLLADALAGRPGVRENFSAAHGKHFEVFVFLLQPGQVACLFRDITPRKKAEEEKAALESQLHQSQKMEAVGALAGGIAHDFNNILGAIVGFTEMALEDAEHGKTSPRELRSVLKAGARARDLVQGLLTFSRKVEPRLKPMNLNKEIRHVHGLLKSSLPRMIDIKLELAEPLDLIEADSTQVEQIVLNLATNSRDAMPEGGSLTIRTQNISLSPEFCRMNAGATPGPHVLLEVRDTGAGMDPQTLRQAFEPFFTTKKSGEGTGLGLAMIYGIVESHQGCLVCRSAPGRGTVFEIYFPSLKEAPRDQEDDSEEGEQLPGGDETVLVVDDEEALLKIAQVLLARRGYRVLTARTGEEALEVFQRRGKEIDLVILDISMPGMGGMKCLRALLALEPRTKVLIASGYASDANIKEALARGAVGFVGKPLHKKELLTAARKALDA